MSLIGIICSEAELNKKILDEFEKKADSKYQLRIPKGDDKTIQFLNYDLPELVVVNLSDKNIDLNFITDQVKKDSWLHNFGIVGLYDKKIDNEKELMERYSSLNILNLLDYTQINSHLVKNVEIIDNNKQIIFQWDLSEKLVENITGSFLIDNDPLAGPVYAGLATTILVHRGFIKPETKANLQVALSELIINGIEHGNCKIRFKEKTAFLMEGGNILDLVAEKCKDPNISARRVYFEWDIHPDLSKFIIRDEGDGFDVKTYINKFKEQDIGVIHGRGIMIARMLASKLTFNTKGNQVTLVINHEMDVNTTMPIGFSGEELVEAKKGEIIFKQNEVSDFLYYICSGRYSVFHGNKQVGSLSPEDIFMGEMSFLLNNRRSASVRAETHGKLVKISRKTFISVVKKYPHYGIFLSKLLARKLVRANMRSAYIQSKGENSITDSAVSMSPDGGLI